MNHIITGAIDLSQQDGLGILDDFGISSAVVIGLLVMVITFAAVPLILAMFKSAKTGDVKTESKQFLGGGMAIAMTTLILGIGLGATAGFLTGILQNFGS